MIDGSGCDHERLIKSFKVPTSLECEQCGKAELRILRARVDSLNTDKSLLLRVISELQDDIAELTCELESLRAFTASEIRKLPREYVKHKTGLNK